MKVIRKYNDYQKYIDHQKEKSLNVARILKWFKDWTLIMKVFSEHFKRNKKYIKGRALCICARTGQEVQALKDIGIDAIGIDIVAYPPLVIEADAHDLPFGSEFDFVFSNSLDHSIYPGIFLSEMQRVLKVGGFGMLHLQITDDVDIYAENIIKDSKDVTELLDSEIIENREIKGIYNREIIFKK